MRSGSAVSGLAAPPLRGLQLTPVGFADLDGWADDDHAEALRVFRATCGALNGPAWARLARLSQGVGTSEARTFFERNFRPVLMQDGEDGLFTGYFEPEIEGDLAPSERCPVPIYRLPPDRPASGPWFTRSEIEAGALDGRGLEIAWARDPIDLFFLQVQGSGRLRLPGGKVMRIGYAGSNGHPYRSIGRALLDRGALSPERSTAEDVRTWLRAHPEEGASVMRINASYVFFRELVDLSADAGPLGTLGQPVTAGRTLAVDPGCVPLGAPVWIEMQGPEPLRRLMVAQDTGSAIKGAQRADIFFGTGVEAGRKAGRVRNGGRMVVLLPADGEGPAPVSAAADAS
ncbi:murein transglycosylase A [Rubellimicrobium arenae]|uniref:murein transglycosylase A n=1 Tax=Rubellimicrobium arenae TaxID=2817372 RepID=UPI0034A1186C